MLNTALEDDRYIVLHVDVDQTQDLLHELLEPLRSPDVDADIPPQGSAILHTEFWGYIEFVKTSAEVALCVAQRFIAWRKKRRELGKPIGVRMSRPGEPLLNLDDCTDEEITYYITVRRKQNEVRITSKRTQKRRLPHIEKQVAFVVFASLLLLMLLTFGSLAIRLFVFARRRVRDSRHVEPPATTPEGRGRRSRMIT
jgi:hypothetical protein